MLYFIILYFRTPSLFKNLVEKPAKTLGSGEEAGQSNPRAVWVSGRPGFTTAAAQAQITSHP